MSRCLSKPYRATDPRTVRGAKKRGWTVVKPALNYVEKASWLGLNMWCERGSAGYWVSSFGLREFAFERGSDALAFQLKWG
jgi:hypothetical protein